MQKRHLTHVLARPAVALTAFLMCLTAAGAQAAFTTLRDNQAYSSGPYLAYVSPFNKGSYVAGRDFIEGMTISPSSFPNQTLMGWSWPDKPCPVGVYDFSAIDYGNYYGTVVPAPIPPRRVGDIHTLRETHDVSYSGNLEGFDAIDDFFLTPNPGDHSVHAFEVEVFLHTPTSAAEFVKTGKPVGTFVGSGIRWTVTVAKTDILFMPADKADVASATVDLKAMLDYAVAQGVIPSTLYFNGFGLGTETTRGKGAMKVNSFSVVYN